jgi:glutamate dehydrogenase (NAD(P)+)
VPSPSMTPLSILECTDPETGLSGWLVVDTLSDGLAFGGCRFSASVTQSEVQGLARAMTWKLAAHGLPVGGAKAGIACDPNDPRLPRFMARFAQDTRPLLEKSVVLGKDMGATDALMDALYQHVGVPQLTPVQERFEGGIPKTLRELTGYKPHMTGLGVAFATRAALGGQSQNVRIAIQGFGLVGAGSAYRLSEMEAHVVAISDVQGGWKVEAGADLQVAAQGARLTRTIPRETLPGTPMSHADLLSADVDVLILAATSYGIDIQDAALIRAPLVVEGANLALTTAARQHLQSQGCIVIPDIIASSSSAAMVTRQMASGNTLSEETLWKAIQQSIEDTTTQAMAAARKDGTDVRTAYLRLMGVASA